MNKKQLRSIFKNKNFKMITIFLLVISIASVFLNLSLFQKIGTLETEVSSQKKAILEKDPKIVLQKIRTEREESFNKFKQLMNDVFNGNIEYETDDSAFPPESFVSEDLVFPEIAYPLEESIWLYVRVKVYKYTPGLKFENGYEGSKWIVDLDKWNNWFNNLNKGVQKIIVYDLYWGEIDSYEIDVELRRIGTYEYAVFERGFQPASVWSRYFVTFDDKNNQIIEIRINKNVRHKGYSFQFCEGYGLVASEIERLFP